MKVLFIGGTGLLSSAVLKKSEEKGFLNIILNRGNKLSPEGVELIKVDIRNVDRVKHLLEKQYFDIIIDFISYNEEQINHNISIFSNKCEQYIFISSAAVYKPGADVIVEDKTALIDETRKYSINKAQAEKCLIKRAHELGINYTIIRPAITYGGKSLPYGLPYGSYPAHGCHRVVMERILYNKPIPLPYESIGLVQPFTYVDDFASGCVGLFGNKAAYNETFHIVDDRYYSWDTVIEAIGEVLVKLPNIIYIPIDFLTSKMSDFRREEIYGMMNKQNINPRYDISKIRRIVPDFHSSITLKDGIAKVVAEYKNPKQTIDIVFDAECDKVIDQYCIAKKNYPNTRYSHFVNYSNEKTLYHKIKYYIIYYDIQFIKIFFRILKRLINKVKRII
jgi:nucleoside-diphosphate-sugar epimerase